ncbi:MAG: hypothetical protein WCV67_03155 [Victivallaceae bacterium]|jgi:hypothetical protein
MNKTLQHICQLISQIAFLALDTPKNFYLLTNEKIAEVYNGAGPDWMSGFERRILTFLLRYFAAAFVIHDVEYYFNQDTADTPANRARFHAANARMWRNIKLINAALWGWYNPRRWYWRSKGWIAYQACEKFGWSAWIAVGSEKNATVLSVKQSIINT